MRPTTDRVREALFSILGDVSGLRVLDLFAGTGALAIEALSRGASEATLVDRDARLARSNLEQLGLTDHALVLCDPPYGLNERTSRRLEPLIRRPLAAGGRAVIESGKEGGTELELPVVVERAYGDTLIRVYSTEGS